MQSRLGGLVLVLALAGGAQAQTKKRVAVMNFDYAAVSSSVRQLFGSDQDVGKGIADMLVDRLVNDGVYSVIERKELDKVLAEQNFSNSDRADPTTAAKIARILGVNVIVIGSITQFGRDDKKTDVGGGALSGVTGRFGVGGRSQISVHGGGADHGADDRYQHGGNPGQLHGERIIVAFRRGNTWRGRRWRIRGGRRDGYEILQFRRYDPG